MLVLWYNPICLPCQRRAVSTGCGRNHQCLKIRRRHWALGNSDDQGPWIASELRHSPGPLLWPGRCIKWDGGNKSPWILSCEESWCLAGRSDSISSMNPPSVSETTSDRLCPHPHTHPWTMVSTIPRCLRAMTLATHSLALFLLRLHDEALPFLYSVRPAWLLSESRIFWKQIR